MSIIVVGLAVEGGAEGDNEFEKYKVHECVYWFHVSRVYDVSRVCKECTRARVGMVLLCVFLTHMYLCELCVFNECSSKRVRQRVLSHFEGVLRMLLRRINTPTRAHFCCCCFTSDLILISCVCACCVHNGAFATTHDVRRSFSDLAMYTAVCRSRYNQYSCCKHSAEGADGSNNNNIRYANVQEHKGFLHISQRENAIPLCTLSFSLRWCSNSKTVESSPFARKRG